MNLDRNIQVGDVLPELTVGPVTRHMLALYAGASGDHNPIHVDIDFARQSGMPDVFAHGMLSAAFLSRMLTNWTDQKHLRSYSVRFLAITHVGDRITCRAEVKEKFSDNGEMRIRLELSAMDQAGEIKLSGEAVVALVAAAEAIPSVSESTPTRER